MPRKPHFFLPDVPVHTVQRGHSRDPVFYEDGDYQAYHGWLLEAAERYDCHIHAYVGNQSDDAVYWQALRSLYQSHLRNEWDALGRAL